MKNSQARVLDNEHNPTIKESLALSELYLSHHAITPVDILHDDNWYTDCYLSFEYAVEAAICRIAKPYFNDLDEEEACFVHPLGVAAMITAIEDDPTGSALPPVNGQRLLYSECAYTAWVQTNTEALFDAVRDDREVVDTLRQLQERAAEILMVS